MLKYILFVLTLIAPATEACASQLALSSELSLSTPTPKKIAHTPELLILKFDDWSLTHQVIDAKNYLPSVDLSGIEKLFIESLFDKKKREKLPKWLDVLALELSHSLAITSGKKIIKRLDKFDIYSAYSEENQEAQIYLLEENQSHSIRLFGSKQEFENIISKLAK